MAWVEKKRRTRYVLHGKVVPKDTPGAEKEVRKSKYYYGFWHENGKLVQRHLVGCTDRRSAQKRLDEILRQEDRREDAQAGEDAGSGDGGVVLGGEQERGRAVQDYLPAYLKHLEMAHGKTHASTHTLGIYRRRLGRFLALLGTRRVGELAANERHVEVLGDPTKVSAKTRSNVAQIVNAFLTWVAAREGVLVGRRLRLYKISPGEKHRARGHGSLTPEELTRLMGALPWEKPEAPRSAKRRARWARRLIYRMIATTLTRAGTCFDLTVGQFDLDGEHPAVHLRANQVKSRRDIVKPLTSGLAEELRLYFEWTGKLADPLARAFDICEYSFYRAWKKDLVRAGLRTSDPAGRILAPHSLKATGITILIDSGLDIATVAELAEHTNVNITLRIYNDSLLRRRPSLKEHLHKLDELVEGVVDEGEEGTS